MFLETPPSKYIFPVKKLSAALICSLLFLAPSTLLAQNNSSRNTVKLQQQMNNAERQYNNALTLISNNNPQGFIESDAALNTMQTTIEQCLKQRGCQANSFLETYKRLLKVKADQEVIDNEPVELATENSTDEPHPLHSNGDALKNNQFSPVENDLKHSFDTMVQYNPAIQAGIRKWLTDMRPSLMNSYENYRSLRPMMWPEWEQRGLPEALLFGIMAKESNGKNHSISRAGAAGLMQFMPSTGSRFGLGRDETGFDTRFDARKAAQASAEYISERFAQLNNNVEFSLAGYNGGEGRALRIYRENPERSFWDSSAYSQFPEETKDYVPMVIAAAWLFLHPQQFGLEFPAPENTPEVFRLKRTSSLYELSICLGNTNSRDGYLRTLRNLNPRYKNEDVLTEGTELNGTETITNLYKTHCINGPRAELAQNLMNANLHQAIAYNPNSVNVAMEPPVLRAAPTPAAVATKPAVAMAKKPTPTVAKKVKSYQVGRGDTLNAVANKFQCDVKTLGKVNNLRAPYSLQIGQQLRLENCKR